MDSNIIRYTWNIYTDLIYTKTIYKAYFINLGNFKFILNIN